MTNLEIVLLAVIWVSYGVFVNIQNNWCDGFDEEQTIAITLTVVFSPIILLARVCKGIFTKI